MNNVYFACTQCKVYVNAGYRWAYLQLEEPRVVHQGDIVNIDGLLSVQSYWKPQAGEQSEWLSSTLARVKAFMHDHQSHIVVYGDMERVIGVNTNEYERFAWMNDHPSDTDLQPRNFIEQLGIRNWGDVTAYIASRPHKPWWYELPAVRLIARRKFEELLAGPSGPIPLSD
jgi:alpha-L-fucosidase